VRQAIDRHPLAAQARRLCERAQLTVSYKEPLLSGDPAELSAEQLARVRPLQVQHWLGTLDEPTRFAWTRGVLAAVEEGVLASKRVFRTAGWGEILLDAALTYPGLELPDFDPGLLDEAFDAMLGEYGVVDGVLAALLARPGLAAPHGAVYTRDAAVTLVGRGQHWAHAVLPLGSLAPGQEPISDQEVLELTQDAEPHVRAGALAARTRSPLLIDAFAPGLVRGDHDVWFVDLFPALEWSEAASEDARLALASHGSAAEIAEWLTSRSVAGPRPGEAAALMRLAHQGRTYDSWSSVVGEIAEYDEPTRALEEAAAEILNLHEGGLLDVIDGEGCLAGLAAQRIAAVAGQSPAAWSTILVLAREWDGTLDGLLSASTAL
jgi:hypothetical protein